MAAQFDLFSKDEPSGAKQPFPLRRVPVQPALTEEDMINRLVASGRYRVLRKLEPREICPPRPNYPLRGVVLDTETTGLDHRNHEIIEIGLVAFSFNEDGEIGEVTAVYGGLQQPSSAIPADITRITGITDSTVAGQRIDLAAVEALVAPADLVIAHNASFDRPFCERFSQIFDGKAWACSNAEIDWTTRGYEGTKLGYLIGQSGYFHEGHRAVDDCFALLEVLASGKGDISPFAELYAASQRCRMRIFAESAPFEMKDHLKARGYRWSDGTSGLPKCWWIEIGEELLEDELRYLRTEVYRWRDADPPVRRLTAFDRFRA